MDVDREVLDRNIYGYPKVYIIGNCARWIKQGLGVRPNSVFIFDRFHLFKSLTNIYGKQSRKEAYVN